MTLELRRGRPGAASRGAWSCGACSTGRFLRPAPTQEAAAEVLGLPFSTYRRHLAAALDQLVELLLGRGRTGEVVLIDRTHPPVSTE